MEGAARQPTSSTSGSSSQHSTASPVIYFRAADRINQSSDSGGSFVPPLAPSSLGTRASDAHTEAASQNKTWILSDEAMMPDTEREKDRDVFDVLLDGILEDHPELDGVILEWDEELVFLLNDDAVSTYPDHLSTLFRFYRTFSVFSARQSSVVTDFLLNL
ncbi:hypothetical protein BKA62DRAFT_725531 [Auriculariales sp. MPI-PUGE-AT-0066]|nr:hypothetical protein BKA62DRAFT_725531 [Auriculariales sp. MPI-PUGE-AT-0066]